MSVVLLVAENKSCGLKESDDKMWFLIYHMRPLVNFIGQNSQHNTKDNCPTVSLDEKIARTNKQTKNDKWWHGIRCTGISLDETMSCDVLGVDMVHSETSDEGGADDGSGKFAPGVAGPMEDTTGEVNHETGSDEAEYDGHGCALGFNGTLYKLPP